MSQHHRVKAPHSEIFATKIEWNSIEFIHQSTDIANLDLVIGGNIE